MGSAEIQGEAWGRAARDWAELQEPFHAPLWGAMLDAAGVDDRSSVCDVGCGGGGASVMAAGRGARVTGLDAAASLIDVARERIPNGDFRVGDMEALPFEDGAFDAVIAANSLQYAADRVAALREMKRVSDLAGRVVVGLFGPPERVGMRSFFKALVEALPAPPPGHGPFELSEPGVLADLVERAGLRVIGNGEAECPFVYEDFEMFWRASLSAGPLQTALRHVDERRLVESVRHGMEPHVGPDGSLAFENTFQYVVAVP